MICVPFVPPVTSPGAARADALRRLVLRNLKAKINKYNQRVREGILPATHLGPLDKMRQHQGARLALRQQWELEFARAEEKHEKYESGLLNLMMRCRITGEVPMDLGMLIGYTRHRLAIMAGSHAGKNGASDPAGGDRWIECFPCQGMYCPEIMQLAPIVDGEHQLTVQVLRDRVVRSLECTDLETIASFCNFDRRSGTAHGSGCAWQARALPPAAAFLLARGQAHDRAA